MPPRVRRNSLHSQGMWTAKVEDCCQSRGKVPLAIYTSIPLILVHDSLAAHH